MGLSYTQEERERVKSDVSLTALASSMGFTVIQKGAYYSIKEMDSIIIYDDRSWKRFSNKGSINGGSQIDFELAFGESQTVPEAIHRLLEFMNDPVSMNRAVFSDYSSGSGRSESVLNGSLQLPPKNQNYKRVFAYLMKTRGLSQEIVSYFAHNKLLYEDAVHHNVVFCGYDPDGNIRYAGMRGTVTYGNKAFKCDVPGNDKNYGVNIVNKDFSELKVFESVIDCMSYMDLTKDYDSNKLVLGMVADNPLERFLMDYDHIRSISFCLDNDEAGRSAVFGGELPGSGYLEKYGSRGYNCQVELPPAGKDWNEFLCDHVDQLFKCGQYSAEDFLTGGSEEQSVTFFRHKGR